MENSQPEGKEDKLVTHPGNRVVTCNWCGALVTRRNLNRHFRDECHKLPTLNPGQRMCARCQEPRDASDFGKRAGLVNDKQHTCRICSRELANRWFANRKSRTPREPKLRPGRWILKPCEWCDALFNWAEMKKHRRGCSKRPAKMLGRPPGPPSDVAVEHMDRVRELAMSAKSRSHKSHQLRWSYGISVEEFDRMYEQQNGKCAICRQVPKAEDWRSDTLHVDHDHGSGKVRRLLCQQCNLGLGAFKDDPALLMAAFEYLLRHKKLGLVS